MRSSGMAVGGGQLHLQKTMQGLPEILLLLGVVIQIHCSIHLKQLALLNE